VPQLSGAHSAVSAFSPVSEMLQRIEGVTAFTKKIRKDLAVNPFTLVDILGESHQADDLAHVIGNRR
jgi:hypothetical protein